MRNFLAVFLLFTFIFVDRASEITTSYIFHQPSSIELMWRRRGLSLDNFVACFRDLSRDGAFVHTSWRRIGGRSWNQPKITVTLHQQK